MIDIEYQALKVKREIGQLEDFIRYYSVNDRERALRCLDKAQTEVLKAKQYAVGVSDGKEKI